MRAMRLLASIAMTRIVFILLSALGSAICGQLGAAPLYSATPLGVIGSKGATGNGINAAGQVAGEFFTAGNAAQHAFVYSDGLSHDLGTLGGPLSTANAISASGQVVGSAFTPIGQIHAFLYTNGVMTDLGTLGGMFSEAYGINSTGQITGFAVASGDDSEHAFLYSDGVMTDLGTHGGRYSHGNGINASGQVVGRYGTQLSDSGGADRAFLYSNGVMSDLGTLGGPSSAATAINDNGDITGRASLYNGVDHAFIYSGGIMHDLTPSGDVESWGNAINAKGQVAGGFVAQPPPGSLEGGEEHAVVYSDGTMHDLNSVTIGMAGTVLVEATGINDGGQIVVNGVSKSSIWQAFRLDPVEQPPPAPERLQAVEYYYANFDHYFITAIPSEINALDNGAFPGWVRTGESFNVYSSATIGTAPVCRFFSDSFAPKSSHFYTPDAGECSFVKGHGTWSFEGVAFALPVPDLQGSCSSIPGIAVYRLFNNGQGGAPNHRYTASLATRAHMIQQGWVSEGYGPLGVIMCAAP